MRWRCLPKDPRGPARRGRGGGRGGRRESRVDRYDEFELEAEERMGNFGDRTSELLCQGVKPLDDDARVSVPVLVLLHLSDCHTIPGLGCS